MYRRKKEVGSMKRKKVLVNNDFSHKHDHGHHGCGALDTECTIGYSDFF